MSVRRTEKGKSNDGGLPVEELFFADCFACLLLSLSLSPSLSLACPIQWHPIST